MMFDSLIISMRIGIDTRWVEYKTGVYRVIVELFVQMLSLEEAKKHEWVLFGVDIFEEAKLEKPENVKIVGLVGWKRKLMQGLWKSVRWPRLELLTGKLDLVFFTNFVAVPLKNKKTKTVVTVHDMAWKLFPETIERKNLRFLEKFCAKSLGEANLVHCVSENTALDVLKLIGGLDQNKVKVFYNAISERFCDLEGEKIAAVEGRYVLFVGTLEPRKNLGVLLAAMERLWDTGSRLKLVIVGAKGWNEELEVGERYRERVIFTGFVSDEQLVGLYRGAEVFVFPSKYEGFGIPVLEAMALGVPVVSADNSSLREVGGGAVEYFDGGVEGLESCLRRILADVNKKLEMSEAGKAQVKRFSWQVSAEKLLAAVERL